MDLLTGWVTWVSAGFGSVCGLREVVVGKGPRVVPVGGLGDCCGIGGAGSVYLKGKIAVRMKNLWCSFAICALVIVILLLGLNDIKVDFCLIFFFEGSAGLIPF